MSRFSRAILASRRFYAVKSYTETINDVKLSHVWGGAMLGTTVGGMIYGGYNADYAEAVYPEAMNWGFIGGCIGFCSPILVPVFVCTLPAWIPLYYRKKSLEANRAAKQQ